jgi:hypothetical protein
MRSCLIINFAGALAYSADSKGHGYLKRCGSDLANAEYAKDFSKDKCLYT